MDNGVLESLPGGNAFRSRFYLPLPAFSVFFLLMIKFLKKDALDNKVTLFIKRTFTAFVWTYWATLFGYAVFYYFTKTLTPYHCLVAYAPLIAMEFRESRNTYYGPVGFVAMRFLFDTPLIISGMLLREVVGLRLFTPFASILDDDIVQGSMPFPSDVKTLVEKYNVKSVINMCGEYPGPQNHYKHYGVEQLRLPRVDTTVPYVEQLKLGATFILKRKMEEPDARIFIHCKGGIARASCMTLAHYILNKSVKDTKKQLGIMKEKRPVVFEGVVPGAVAIDAPRK
ncbi:hypothetical protein TL16_g06061 [Triparma laevis f. inornata]|uniref:Tyrosine specific protein phosphatases domain-containing protein n=2 Tax=Triparma laevis TaxID=1534972 RepID=A0A9W7DRI4_9STRA|nr:hypothetical protein TrLO_g7819 [Triparma laevis f. longispina]GMH72989.1 hypothetical protein TL16_g06061 [Triparma laevis f. inornata]